MNRASSSMGSGGGRLRRLAWRIAAVVALLAAFAGAFLAGAFTYRERDSILAWFNKSRTGAEILETSLYNVAIEKVDIPAQGRDGAIEALADGILFVNRLGDAWFIGSDHKPRKLGVRVPVNHAEFNADPFNAKTVMRDRFAVKDILLQRVPGGVRLLASYNFWQANDDCYVLRVAALDTTEERLLGADAGINDGWRPIFDTVPCRGLTPSKNGENWMPTLGAGGRLAALSASEILLSVGGFGAETLTEETVAPSEGPRSYGKTVLINVETGESRNFSSGHRNPQGLAVGSDGSIWLTDHGARGGDELNRVIEGRDYGHPSVSYGTEYEFLVWRRNPRQGHHDGFEKPTYAWIPSIATSQLAIVEKPLFASWQGDLLVTSLRAQTLYRVRIEDGRAIFAEPITIGHRIRDIVEAEDGTVVMKTDDNLLVYLRPVDATTMYRMNLPQDARGQVLASACASCHEMSPDAPDGIGPNLWQVLGRDIASRQSYGYSPALHAINGSWTEDKLIKFIRDPQAFAPGTTMATTTQLNQQQLEDLVAYLSRLR